MFKINFDQTLERNIINTDERSFQHNDFLANSFWNPWEALFVCFFGGAKTVKKRVPAKRGAKRVPHYILNYWLKGRSMEGRTRARAIRAALWSVPTEGASQCSLGSPRGESGAEKQTAPECGRKWPTTSPGSAPTWVNKCKNVQCK